MRLDTGTAFEPVGRCCEARHLLRSTRLHLQLSLEIQTSEWSAKKTGNTANTVRPKNGA
jgi:hypothetical protein